MPQQVFHASHCCFSPLCIMLSRSDVSLLTTLPMVFDGDTRQSTHAGSCLIISFTESAFIACRPLRTMTSAPETLAVKAAQLQISPEAHACKGAGVMVRLAQPFLCDASCIRSEVLHTRASAVTQSDSHTQGLQRSVNLALPWLGYHRLHLRSSLLL